MNKVGDDGARGFAAMLDPTGGEDDCMLHSLELAGNAITDDGASVLASALRTNLSLHHINLCSNFLSESAVSVLEEQDSHMGANGRVNAAFRACLHLSLV